MRTGEDAKRTLELDKNQAGRTHRPEASTLAVESESHDADETVASILVGKSTDCTLNLNITLNLNARYV